MGEALHEVCHDVDYHICGDTTLGDIDEYRGAVIEKFRSILDEADQAHRRTFFNKAMAKEGY